MPGCDLRAFRHQYPAGLIRANQRNRDTRGQRDPAPRRCPLYPRGSVQRIIGPPQHVETERPAVAVSVFADETAQSHRWETGPSGYGGPRNVPGRGPAETGSPSARFPPRDGSRKAAQGAGRNAQADCAVPTTRRPPEVARTWDRCFNDITVQGINNPTSDQN